MTSSFVTSDAIRNKFSRAMSDMYQAEVPQYGALLDLVAQVNAQTLQADPELHRRLQEADEIARLSVERHGAIRLGTAQELATIARLFKVMGMDPVGYYDLSVAGIPVHSTAFRPMSDASLAINPFRVFTSLLRLDLIADVDLRQEAEAILAKRKIFTDPLMALLDQAEAEGGLDEADAARFVAAALETFRWHKQAAVDLETYKRMHHAHRLIADIVCFRGPHINHLTPRTLDIDQAQLEMPRHGISAKDTIEGPPKRRVMILLRQTSFKALEETISFNGQAAGTHTARFGEIEQRGIALTEAGRALYDRILADVMAHTHKSTAAQYDQVLRDAFAAFPDDEEELYQEGLAYFRYRPREGADAAAGKGKSLPQLLEAGLVQRDPIIYEDFLPVSAAGIFQSNLGTGGERDYGASNASETAFMAALGQKPADPFALYAAAAQASRDQTLAYFA